ncbi:DUF5623 domain-containing protein [Pseudomonas grimontii]|uniref:DUF5623 domain-containing protein n=1 Tax=Pseudomonas grimontii TaxID=129847 RepID=UPI00387B01F8
MNSFEVKPSTLGGIKSLAKKIKRDLGIPHHEALDLSAREAGFQNYRHAQQLGGSAPHLHTMFLSAYWYGSEGTGRETLMLQIEKPLSEIASRSQLEHGKHLIPFRLEFVDHLEYRVDLESQFEARDQLYAAARSIVFMDTLSLRPATIAEQNALLSQFNNLPGKDHPSFWAHKITGALVFMDEPYNPEIGERTAWASDHNIHMLSAEWRGIYRPGRTIPNIFCSDQVTMTLLLDQAHRLEKGACEIHGDMESAPYHSQFISPSREAACKKRRPRPMPAMPGIEVEGALPYGASIGGQTSLWRPAKRMTLDRHLEVASLLTSLHYSGMPSACNSPYTDVRIALSEWLSLEFPDDEEITDVQRESYFYNSTPMNIRKGTQQLEVINKISDLLQQGYADCKQLQAVLKKLRRMHAAISLKL